MLRRTDNTWNWKIPTAIGGTLIVVLGISLFAFRAPAKGTLAGRVVCKGKPVVVGTIVVLAGDGKLRAVPIEADGSYQVAGVPQGKVQLGVISRDPAKIQERYAKMAAPTDRLASDDRVAPQQVNKKNWFPVPKQYEDPHYSGLETTLKGQDKFDIELR
jgi:hypothetical protein